MYCANPATWWLQNSPFCGCHAVERRSVWPVLDASGLRFNTQRVGVRGREGYGCDSVWQLYPARERAEKKIKILTTGKQRFYNRKLGKKNGWMVIFDHQNRKGDGDMLSIPLDNTQHFCCDNNSVVAMLNTVSLHHWT